jgi:hypothetical protein
MALAGVVIVGVSNDILTEKGEAPSAALIVVQHLWKTSRVGDLLCGFHAITLVDVLRFSETK